MNFDSFDFFMGLSVFLLIIFLGISFLIDTHNRSITEDEKKCVEFYKKNNYILDSCNKYREKLED